MNNNILATTKEIINYLSSTYSYNPTRKQLYVLVDRYGFPATRIANNLITTKENISKWMNSVIKNEVSYLPSRYDINKVKKKRGRKAIPDNEKIQNLLNNKVHKKKKKSIKINQQEIINEIIKEFNWINDISLKYIENVAIKLALKGLTKKQISVIVKTLFFSFYREVRLKYEKEGVPYIDFTYKLPQKKYYE